MSKHKLLLADDSITIQKVVNLTFADEGIEVISVSDGTSAMEKFVEAAPDLVMVDVNMPGVDGYRICELIKQDEKTRDVPVILLVGSFEPFDEEEARRVGANDYLTKPFQSIRQLVNKVTVLLNRSNGHGLAAEPSESQVASVDEVIAPADPVALELGDAGMDDEMIETDQIGAEAGDSQPLTIEGIAEPAAEESVQTALGQPAAESAVDSGYSEIRDFSDDRAAQLEEQMISEFGSDGSAPAVTEEFEAPRLTSPEDYFAASEPVNEFAPSDVVSEGVPEPEEFAPSEIASEAAPEPEEIVGDMGFGFQADASEPEALSSEPDGSDWGAPRPQALDSEVGGATEASEVAEKDARADIQEISVEAETSDTFVVAQDAAAAAEPAEFSEQPRAEDLSPVIEEAEPEALAEGESPDDADEAVIPVQEAQSEPFESGGQTQSVEIESAVEMQPASELFEAKLEYPPALEEDRAIAPTVPLETAEDAGPADQPEEISAFHAEMPEMEAAFDQTGFPVPDFSSNPATVWAEEHGELREQPAVEEPERIPQEAAEITDEEPAESPAESGQTETPEAPEEIKSLVSNKDRTDAVESVIVSEFARHSISLSSEAVETIAARIAEKISEKIIQEMASEVVSDLADLIVERMERKRQQE